MNEKPILRAVPNEETVLFYPEDYGQQADSARGCIGHLRGDFGRAGNEFWTTWWNHNSEWNTPDFKSDIDCMVNELRKNSLLKDLFAMQKVCGSVPEAMIPGSWDKSHGFRCDSQNYSYYIRAMTNPGDYNFYIYCYQRDKLERYLASSQQESAPSDGGTQQGGMTLG